MPSLYLLWQLVGAALLAVLLALLARRGGMP
jgi:hypothetical protein